MAGGGGFRPEELFQRRGRISARLRVASIGTDQETFAGDTRTRETYKLESNKSDTAAVKARRFLLKKPASIGKIDGARLRVWVYRMKGRTRSPLTIFLALLTIAVTGCS